MSNTLSNQMVEWNTIPWRKLECRVFKLQKRIFQASQRGDVKAVRKLQKTLMRSWSAKAIAIRKVSQDNQGKKTAGVDGVKSLTPKARLSLIFNLKLTNQVKATRRVWIPKPGTSEKRPLSIPTMQDRATQALVKLALEPEWEAVFEPNSYGFRPGRSTHDAIEAIFNSIKQKPKWVLDADISQCFDKINHQALLKKINTFIRGWTNYYSSVVSKEIFTLLDHLIFQKLQAWAKRRHPDKSKSWISSKYWGTVGNNNWVFSTKHEGKITFTLLKYAKTEIVRHIKVEGKNSPFDGNLVYWSERRGKNPLLPLRVTTLLKEQKGKCTHCGLHFREDDVMEVDHIIPKSKGGRNDYKNLQLLHRHCHDVKTTIFGSRYARQASNY